MLLLLETILINHTILHLLFSWEMMNFQMWILEYSSRLQTILTQISLPCKYSKISWVNIGLINILANIWMPQTDNTPSSIRSSETGLMSPYTSVIISPTVTLDCSETTYLEMKYLPLRCYTSVRLFYLSMPVIWILLNYSELRTKYTIHLLINLILLKLFNL